MTDPNPSRKKKKITYVASPQGVEKAEKALKRLGFASKSSFAESIFMSRSTVTDFFMRRPIQLDSLKRICEKLTLKWQEVVLEDNVHSEQDIGGRVSELVSSPTPYTPHPTPAPEGLGEAEPSRQLEINESSQKEINQGVEPVQKIYRQVTVLDQRSQVIKAEIRLEGDIESINNDLLVLLQAILREFSGDTIKITDIKEGSIRLFIEGSPEDIQRLIDKFNSGELAEVRGFPVEDVQRVSESSDDESHELNDKWRLVQEIVSEPVDGRKLSDADLSDADLSGADLSSADLRGADLSGADLSGADLRGANLNGADLRGANLNGADLKNADLSRAYLSFTNLGDANLSGVKLSFAYLGDANLSDANLEDANLSGVKLSSANLENANLSNADLSGANLILANLSGADLSGANLIFARLNFADLSDVNLSDAVVKKAKFGDNLGLTEEMKLDLKRRGAIFEDSPGDRSGVLSRR